VSRSFSALVVAFMIRGFKEFGDTSRKASLSDIANHGAASKWLAHTIWSAI